MTAPPLPLSSQGDTLSDEFSWRGNLFHRVIKTALLLLALLVLAPAQGAVPQGADRIVAVGDLHGDYDAWIAIARAAGLIDAQNRWTGGKTTLVQLGDIADRGPDSLKIIHNLQQLQRDAPKKGGRVVVVLGNHEAMNLLGDLRYVTPQEFAAFADNKSVARRERIYMANRQKLEDAAHQVDPNLKPSQVRDQWLAQTPLGWVEHRAAWSPSGDIGRWAAANPAAIKIGSTVFVHGGLSAEYAAIGIDEINRRVAAAMSSADLSPTSVLNDPLGPLWYRGLVTRDPKVDPDGAAAAAVKPRPPLDQEIASVLTATGAKRIVVGHTPSLQGIIVSNDGRLVRIDTGISRYYGGPLSYLEIVGDRLVPHTVPRPPQGAAR
ncbi:metallophosphoesterase [Sphingomonas hankyongi]|uniref:Metallophosphoesterase n=1 Tax=Sphingomonas hankyongi TaxID=2908209 RepID=A0ABT0S1I0_9SPHN|nr:metallophosphoesterase [Sphingomonas hankyongi]MCL6729471.1 metallophosphoesterase [Sphingomonas hankyongi]